MLASVLEVGTAGLRLPEAQGSGRVWGFLTTPVTVTALKDKNQAEYKKNVMIQKQDKPLPRP